MKRLSVLAFLLACVTTFLVGQDNTILKGVAAFQDQDYEKAVSLLEEGLTNPNAVKAKNAAKGYVHLMQTYLRLGQSPAKKANYPMAFLKAHDSYVKAKQYDTKGKYKEALAATHDFLYQAIYNEGATAYNSKDYRKTKLHFERAMQLDGNDYNPVVLLGFTHFLVNDTAGAIKFLDKGINLYLDKSPEKKDPVVSSAFTQKALLLMQKGDHKAALETAAMGLKEFPQNKDLSRLELSIYAKKPEMFADGKSKFEEALKKSPRDTEVKLAFADLLARNNDKDRAMTLYKEIYQQSSKNYVANVNLGVHHINAAAELSKEMTASDTEETRAIELEKLVITQLQKAYPYMKEAHAQKPDYLEWVNQLVNIATYVPAFSGDLEKWTTKQKALLK